MNKVKRNLLLGTFAMLSSTGCSMLADLNTESLSSALNSADPTGGAVGDLGSQVENAQKIAKGVSVTDAEVVKHAAGYATEFDQESKVAPASSPYAKRLNKLVSKHIKEDGLKLDFKVYLSPEVNAFALANGSIRVYSGLMDRLNDAELLSVIGHEIGHVKLGHSKAQLKQALITDGLTSMGTTYAGSKASDSLGLAGGGMADGLVKDATNAVGDKMKSVIMAKFSRDDERAADDYGLTFLKKNKYDTQGAIGALNKLAALSEGEESELAFLTSSHPDPLSRAERLAEQLGTPLPPADEAPVMHASADMNKTADAASQSDAVESDSKTLRIVDSADAAPPLDPDRTWVIQVAAEEDEILAREKVSMLAELGARAQIQQAVVNGRTYFRVLVGSYANKAAAMADLPRVSGFNVRQGDPFVKPL